MPSFIEIAILLPTLEKVAKESLHRKAMARASEKPAVTGTTRKAPSLTSGSDRKIDNITIIKEEAIP